MAKNAGAGVEWSMYVPLSKKYLSFMAREAELGRRVSDQHELEVALMRIVA